MTATATTFATAAEFRAALHRASVALREARNAAQPLPADIVEWARVKNPAQFAEYETALAAAIAAVPAAQAEFDRIDALACNRCNGTGEYAGRSNYRNRQGVKTCFSCKGDGRCAAAR